MAVLSNSSRHGMWQSKGASVTAVTVLSRSSSQQWRYKGAAATAMTVLSRSSSSGFLLARLGYTRGILGCARGRLLWEI